MSNESTPLTDEQIAAFRRDGYVSLPPLCDEREVAYLRGIFDALFSKPADGGAPLYQDLTAGDPDAEERADSVPQLLWPSRRVPALKQTRAWRQGMELASRLLDMGDYTIDDLVVRDHAIVKPPGSTGPTPWHQDEAYWELHLDYNELSVWIALQETTESMGCMQFVPASHKGEIVPHHPWKNDPNIVALEAEADAFDAGKAVACPLPAGGATVHHARTLHYTTGNSSDEPRRAFIMTIGTPPQERATPKRFAWASDRMRSYQAPGTSAEGSD